MKSSIYVLTLVFHDWDACWNLVHDKRLMGDEALYAVCTQVDTDPFATVRPRVRPWSEEQGQRMKEREKK